MATIPRPHGEARSLCTQGPWWYDQAAGFHVYVVNNVITGQVDVSSNHSDGNGIISDRGGKSSPALIANNVVYMNGGRCIHSYLTNHVWIVNNTCYKNLLDSRVGGSSTQPSFRRERYGRPLDQQRCLRVDPRVVQHQSASQVLLSRNVQFGPQSTNVPASVLADPNQLRTADPMFASPPNVSPPGTDSGRTGRPPGRSEGPSP